MKTRIYALVILLSAIVGAKAAQVLTINGVQVDKIVTSITFDGDNVVLHFNGGSESHDLNDVVISFPTSSGIEDITAYSFNGVIDGKIEIGGLQTGSLIEIFDMSGKRMLTATMDNDPTVINVDRLIKGVYLLKSGKNCVKFVKP